MAALPRSAKFRTSDAKRYQSPPVPGDNEAMTTAANDDVTVTVVDDIIRLKWTEGITITEPAARIAAAYVNQVSADRRRPMVVDMSLTASVTRQARTVFLEPGAASSIALVGRSPVDRVIANFVLGVSNLPCPTRFFTSEAAALEWLSSVAIA